MSNDHNEINRQDDLEAENKFLKMKLMLERGAHFGSPSDHELPPEIENDFLKNVMEFERQWENVKLIKLYDRIGRPTHFKPVGEIPDEEIGKSWKELSDYLNSYNIGLDVCSPNISAKELYRFTMEELFEQEIEDMDIPGMNTCFIYDEFHPDPLYDNPRQVEDDLFRDIFRKQDLFCRHQYFKDGFSFNGKRFEEWQLFNSLIGNFKFAFDEIDLVEFSVGSCELEGQQCIVTGNYVATAATKGETMNFQGGYAVELRKGELGYWEFTSIHIDGFNPE